MNDRGVLLDTGPLVALLSANDVNHARARELFAACAPPLRCCEAVLDGGMLSDAESSFRRPRRSRGTWTTQRVPVAMAVDEHWTNIEMLLKK